MRATVRRSGEWPHTDFSRHSVAYDEIVSGGPPKDGIPAIDQPSFVAVADARGLTPHAPVISVQIGGEARQAIGGVKPSARWPPARRRGARLLQPVNAIEF